MEHFRQELRRVFRSLLRHPAFSLTVLLLLALGIGANTAIFSLVHAALLRPLPFAQPERLVAVYETNLEKGRLRSVASPRNVEDWQRESQTVEQFAVFRDWGFTLPTPEGPEGVSGAIASPELFRLLGVEAVHGRTFLEEENRPGSDGVLLLGYGFWQRRFGGDPGIVNQTLTIKGRSFTVVGVLPPSVETIGLGKVEIWAPVSIDPDQAKERHLRNRRVIARLKEGAALEEARTELAIIAGRLAEQYPAENAGWGATLLPLRESLTGDVRPALLTFLAAVALVLLVACVNVANLMLSRAAARRKEFAIREALGANRWRIVRHLLTESLTLALLGGACGLLVARWALDALLAFSPIKLAGPGEVSLNGAVLGFALLVSLLTGLTFGIWPALQTSRVNLVEELKEGGKGWRLGAGGRLRSLLIVAQVAMALVLLVGAGLLAQTFLRLVNLQPGYEPENLVVFQVFPPQERYRNAEQVREFYQRLTAEMEALPGVRSVSAVSAGPHFGGWEPVEFLPEGQSPASEGQYPQARFYNTGPGYFHTLGTPVLRGREFTTADQTGTPRVAVINATMAERFWAGEDPVGKHLRLIREGDELEIVGVVGDIRRYGLNAEVEPEIFWPYQQQTRWAIYFVVRAAGDPGVVTSAVRPRVASLDQSVFVGRISKVEDLIAASLKESRFNLILVGVFAAVALLLAAIGLYGVVSYAVTQRTRELAIRMALGATRHNVLGLVLRQGFVLTLTGTLVGAVAALLLTRFLANLLYGVSGSDPLTFAAAALTLLLVSLAASYLPARRAAGVDPMEALRHE